MKIGSFWGPCLEAFERYRWLFPIRIQKGLRKARELQEILAEQEASCIYPYEGFVHRTPDLKLFIRVLWPAGRLLERLLLGKDAVDLFTRYPMPQGWLLSPGPEPPEQPRALATLRSTIRASSFLKPDEIPGLPALTPYENIEELAKSWGAEYGLDPEFFGNPVLNDTSLVLKIDVLLDGMLRRTVLLPGDLENWLYLTAKHGDPLYCDVLKVPHHGGRVFIERNDHTAFDEIYQWLRPVVAMVSATGKHHLPRAKFRETIRRWGANLFCPCRRKREIVIGDLSASECCRDVFDCERTNDTTAIELTATTIEADAPACSSELAQESTRVVRMVQHVIEPSDIALRMTEGELDRHIAWLKKQLAELHKKRLNIDNWRNPANAIEVDVLKNLAQEEKRYLLVAEIETVLKEAHRRGQLWYHPGGYNDPAKAYRLPIEEDRGKAWKWLKNKVAVLMPFLDDVSVSRLTADEILNKVDSRVIAENIAAETGYPPQIFGSAMWPFLAAKLRDQWHGYFRDARHSTGYLFSARHPNMNLLILSSADSCEKLADKLRHDVPRSTWREYCDHNQKYNSLNSKIIVESEWPLYDNLSDYMLFIGKSGNTDGTEHIDLAIKWLFHDTYGSRANKETPITNIAKGLQKLW